MRVILAVVAALTLMGAGHAPSHLQQFEAAYQPILTTTGQAMTARMCGLRSESWTRDIMLGLQMQGQVLAQRFQLTDSEREQAEPYLQAHIKAQFPNESVCRQLSTDGTLDRLDQIQWNLTGGYH